jgi:hypothetical protein
MTSTPALFEVDSVLPAGPDAPSHARSSDPTVLLRLTTDRLHRSGGSVAAPRPSGPVAAIRIKVRVEKRSGIGAKNELHRRGMQRWA